jgi:hypothetical protein
MNALTGLIVFNLFIAVGGIIAALMCNLYYRITGKL